MNHYQKSLGQLKQQGRYRKRYIVSERQAAHIVCQDKTCVNFCSNDYLGLATDPRLITAFTQAAGRFGLGSSASPLISGYSQAHADLEYAFAQFFQHDAALYFTSGYSANLAVLKALSIQKNTIVFADKFCHASLIDGCHLAQLRLKRYRHGDLEHLQYLLKNADTTLPKLIITDGVFSMDGDLADLPGLITLAHNYQCLLMVDDTHGFGVLGENGHGTLSLQRINQDDVPLISVSLGKAAGGSGAIVTGKQEFIDTILQFGRSYIYSTAISPAMAHAMGVSLQLIQQATDRREHLQGLINYFRTQAKQLNISLLPSTTPIQALIIGSETETLATTQYLFEQGFWVSAIRPPTVPPHTSRLRVTLNYHHTQSHIDQLLAALSHSPYYSCARANET